MLYSMTGFGKAIVPFGKGKLMIELKTVNSKFADVGLRVDPLLKDQEMAIKNRITEKIIRGKAELSITLDGQKERAGINLNRDLIRQHYAEIKDLADSLNEPPQPLLPLVMRLGDVYSHQSPQLSEEDLLQIENAIDVSISALMEFRKIEGQRLEADFVFRLNLLSEYCEQTETLSETRLPQVRERILSRLHALLEPANVDQNRLEQEIIYYLEKLDITEELVRLRSHVDFFWETLATQEVMKGKKLSFITQEMGREINTIGSKANDAAMQRVVVQMKDELEKIKEQINNIL